MPNGTYGGVRGRKTKVGRKLLRFPPTRLLIPFPILRFILLSFPSLSPNPLINIFAAIRKPDSSES